MREWIPVPGSAKARLVQAALTHFEAHGFEGASVVEMAGDADVTTGSLYHHFGSKHGLFDFVRLEMQRRIRDRMEGAHAAIGAAIGGRDGVASALLVGFDAAVKFKAARILSEPPSEGSDLLHETLAALVAPRPPAAASVLLGAWRAALGVVAGGVSAAEAREALVWVLGGAAT